MTYANQSVLVVGASSGIGAAVARALVQQGAQVGALARRLDRLQALPGVYPVRVDVGDQDQVDQAVATLHHQLGAFDAVFNFAGIGLAKPTDHVTPQELQALMRTNVLGARHLMTATEPFLKPSAHIGICSSGIIELPPIPGLEYYRLSKKFLEAYIKSLRNNFRKTHPGVTVTAVLPGIVDTEIWKKTGDGPMRTLLALVGRHAFSAERCAQQILRDVATGKERSFPTPDVAVLKELERPMKRLLRK